MALFLDFETRSLLDLSTVGVYRYAAHSSTEILCMAWAIDDGPVRMWEAIEGVPFPGAVEEYHGEFHAWNAQFERLIVRDVLPRMIPGLASFTVPIHDWHCTMVDALSMGLPGKLERCALVVLGSDGEQKDKKGHALMLRMSKPRTTDPLIWWEDPARLQRLYAYCMQDVVVERAIAKKLRPLSPPEQRLWCLDQTINDRGVALDLPLIHAAQAIVTEALSRADTELQVLTEGAVTSVSEVTRLGTFLGVSTVAKDAITALLADPTLADIPRRVAEIRQEAGMASIAKLKTMVAMTNDDGRARGTMQFHAAHTGRWGGRGIQPQNFARGTVEHADACLPVVRRGRDGYDSLALLDHPLHVVSSLMRGMLIPSKGKQFSSYDYSAIEPRVTAWLAGQEDALVRYRANEDEYLVIASEIYGLPISALKKHPHRQLGKATLLGAIFGLGWKGLQRAAAKGPYYLDIDYALAMTAVTAFRAKWDMIPKFWKALEYVVLLVVKHPRVTHQVGVHLTFVADGTWLLVKLPSGRLLTYTRPVIRDEMMPWGTMKEIVYVEGENSLTKKWESYPLWGGFLTENITQAVARDVMADRMPALEAAGILPVLSVHDEIVCEVSSVAEHTRMGEIMGQVPTWATGLPIALEGWIGDRYRK